MAEETAVASQAAKRPPVVNYPGEGFREMTKAQWAALPRDCKAVRSVAETEDHGAYRYRRTMDNNFRLVNVYITDMKSRKSHRNKVYPPGKSPGDDGDNDMHSQLRERIRLMRARLDNAAPVAEIRAESQLFVTPAPVCDRLVTLAEISNRDHILEPSAGTGAILRAIRDTAPEAMCDAVEINSGLVRYLRENFNGVRVQCGDFMEWQPVQYYSRIIMNPPFSHGQDIRHILRAFPCCVRGAFWLPSVSTGHASRRSCYRFLTSARSCRAARLLIPMSRR